MTAILDRLEILYVVGILATQGEAIDREDLEGAAAELGLGELLARAFAEAGAP